MSLLIGCISFLTLALVIPPAIRLIRPQNAIPTIIAIAIVIHLLGTLAGAAWLGELDYWQSAAVYWFATVILIYAYGTCCWLRERIRRAGYRANRCAGASAIAGARPDSFQMREGHPR